MARCAAAAARVQFHEGHTAPAAVVAPVGARAPHPTHVLRLTEPPRWRFARRAGANVRARMTAAPSAAALPRGNALPSGENDYNLYSGLTAIGLGLFGCLLARYSNGGHGPRPLGDKLSWLVHTRLGPGPKSWLGRQLDLGVLLSATYGELLVVSVYVGWLVTRFAYYLQSFSEAETTALRVGKAFGRLGAAMITMTYLLAQRCVARCCVALGHVTHAHCLSGSPSGAGWQASRTSG